MSAGTLLPLAAAALGVTTIGMAYLGTGNRPLLAGLVIAAGTAAALLPLRYGLALAVVLASFSTFFADFAGHQATYWNEAFVGLLAARSLVARRPSRREILAAAGVGLPFLAYLASGSDTRAVFWAAKVLLTSVVVGWSVLRLRVGWPEWRSLYYGLCVATGASVILAIWQRSKGVAGLQDLGLDYGERIRQTASGGAVRGFAGFTSPAGLAYMLAIAICCWAGLALSGDRHRRLALTTAWLPPIAVAGIVLAVDRTAFVGLIAAILVLAIGYRTRILAPAAVALVIAIVAIAATVPSSRHLGEDAASTAHARARLWLTYLEDFKAFGEGPATSGSAYRRVAPKGWVPPLSAPNNWNVHYGGISLGSPSEARVQTRLSRRPPLSITAEAKAVAVPRQLTVALRGVGAAPDRELADSTIPVDRAVPILVSVPAGRLPAATLSFTAQPTTTPEVADLAAVPYAPGALTNLVTNPSFEGGTGGWQPYQGTGDGTVISRVAGNAALGKASLRISGAKVLQESQGVLYQYFQLVWGQAYTVSLALRGESGGEDVYIQVNQWLPHAVASLGPRMRLSSTWQRRSFTFVAKGTTNATVFVRRPFTASLLGSGATFYVDAVQIEPSAAATSYCDGSIDNCRWLGDPNASWSARGGSTVLAQDIGSGARPGRAETLRVRSTGLPMPQRPPFAITVDREELEVVSILDSSTYLVRRGANLTTSTEHRASSVVYGNVKRLGPRNIFKAIGFDPDRGSPSRTPVAPAHETAATPVVELRNLRVAGLPKPETPAERIWSRWFEKTPAALEGDGPGLVDNLYVSWIFQYGLLGIVLCLAWLGVLLWPALRRKTGPALIAASLVGVFIVVAALAVNVWEEAPTDLLTALVLALGFAEARRLPAPTSRQRRDRGRAALERQST